MLNGRIPGEDAFKMSDIPRARLFMLYSIIEAKRRATTVELLHDEEEELEMEDVTITDEERDQQQALFDIYAKERKKNEEYYAQDVKISEKLVFDLT
jgi:hypothetical protein